MSYNKRSGRKRKKRKTLRDNPDSLIWCLCNIIKAIFALFAWVPHFVARHTYRLFVKFFHVKEKHYKLGMRIAFGFVLLSISYFFERIWHHPAWAVTIDSMRCAAVCPIVDGCYDLLKIADEMA